MHEQFDWFDDDTSDGSIGLEIVHGPYPQAEHAYGYARAITDALANGSIDATTADDLHINLMFAEMEAVSGSQLTNEDKADVMANFDETTIKHVAERAAHPVTSDVYQRRLAMISVLGEDYAGYDEAA